MSFKGAIGCSVIAHMGLLVLQVPEGFVAREEIRPIKVTYVAVAKVKLQPAPAVPRSRESSSGVAVSGTQASPSSRRPTNNENRQAENLIRLGHLLPSTPAPEPLLRHVPVTVQDVPTPGSSSAIASLPEGEFALLQHKQMVRQYLKTHLIFPPHGVAGTVRLRLVLRPNGTLENLLLLAASDPHLAESALKEAQSSAPYPPFPKELKKEEADYEFIVQYRLE